MTSLGRVTGLIGLAAGLLLSAGGCSDYTYYNVHVTLAQTGSDYVDTQTLYYITNCSVAVFANGQQIERRRPLTKIDGTSACPPGNTPDDLGVLDYSTAKQSGSIKFVVTMAGADNKDLAQGTTEASVSPGKVLNVDLAIQKCPTAPADSNSACPITNLQ